MRLNLSNEGYQDTMSPNTWYRDSKTHARSFFNPPLLNPPASLPPKPKIKVHSNSPNQLPRYLQAPPETSSTHKFHLHRYETSPSNNLFPPHSLPPASKKDDLHSMRIHNFRNSNSPSSIFPLTRKKPSKYPHSRRPTQNPLTHRIPVSLSSSIPIN